MRIDKKQKKKEIVLKIIVTFGLVKILIEVTTMSNKTKDISSRKRKYHIIGTIYRQIW